MKILKPLLISIYIKIKNITPKKYQHIFEDYFFLYTPIWLLRKVTFAYDGYLMHFKPNKGDVVLDCGAYEGHFSIIASRLVGNKGLVYSFEPQDEMADTMSKKFLKYGLSNIRVINKGIFSHKSSMLVDKGTYNAGFSIVDLDESVNDQVRIDLIDIDSFVIDYKLKRLDFVKMDIEGAEIEALIGAKKALNKFFPKVVIASYHIRDGSKTAVWVEKFLVEQGFKSWTGFPAHLTTYGIKK
jgi:FkbM family methyltransferase